MPSFLIKKLLGYKKETRVGYYLKGKIMKDEENVNFISRRIENLYAEFLKKMEVKDVDVLLSPGLVTPAIKH